MNDPADRDDPALSDSTEGLTWPKDSAEETATRPYIETAITSDPPASPQLRRPITTEKKNTLRDLAVPAPNKKPTIPYLDRLPPSEPGPPPQPIDASPDDGDDITQLRLGAEPILFYIERDSVPAPEGPQDPFDAAQTQPLPLLDEATTQIKHHQRPSAMNLGKLASPRYGVMGEPVRIATGKPSAMRLNRVEPLLDLPNDATTGAPVETPTELPRPSLSGQRLHSALPILTGLAFIAIGVAITVTLMRDPGSKAAPVSTLATTPPAARTAPTPPTTAVAPAPSPAPAPRPVPASPAAQSSSSAAPPAAASPATPPTPRKKPRSRPTSPTSPSPKAKGDDLGELPF